LTGGPVMVSISRIVRAVLLLYVLLPAFSRAQGDPALAPGPYRLEMIMAIVAHLPFFGSSRSASKSTALVHIRRDGSGWVQSHEVCDFRVLEGSTMIKLNFPEKFVTSLAKHSYPIQLEKDEHGWRYHADLGIERIGYKAAPGDDRLPSRIDDPSVFDWDGDGHPGATLELSVPLLPPGKLYIVQTGRSVLDGRITETGTIEGGIDVQSFQQRVLGARPSFLHRSPEIHADPKASRFTIIPVAAGTTCQALKTALGAGKRGDTAAAGGRS
jgi:hypothetical protein